MLEELERNLSRHGIARHAASHRITQMNKYFPDAEVTGYERLIPAMTNDAKDRHVLAAAVRGQAGIIVTENLKDFPASSLKPYDLDLAHQDKFLLDQLDLQPVRVRTAVRRQASRYRREPKTTEDLLIALGRHAGAAGFATQFTGYSPKLDVE